MGEKEPLSATAVNGQNALPRPYYQDSSVTLYHGDSRHILPRLPPHTLLLTDPPYGINENPRKIASRGRQAIVRDYGDFDWDAKPAPQWLLQCAIELCDKSIIFGGNYYALPPTSCWLIWNKLNGECDFADAELAWTNLKKAVRMIDHVWKGMIRQNGEFREHPTQKPLRVICWCLEQAGEIESVLDPFAGSGTTLVAAKLRNLRATGIEREERYCEIAARRMEQEIMDFKASAICPVEERSPLEPLLIP